MTEVEG